MKPLSESGLSNKRRLLQRAYVVAAFLVILAIAVFVKLIRVQYFETFEGRSWKEYSKENEIKVDTIPAMRGNIYAHDSSLLATSLPFYYIGLDTRTASDEYFSAHLDELATLLSKSFGKSTEYHRSRILSAKLRKKPKYIRLWPRDITHIGKATVESWPFFRKQKGGGGGIFEMDYKRYKPFSPMADRTIGVLNKKTGKGLVGIEASFEKPLSGKSGFESVEVVEGGRKIPIGDGNNIRPEPGLDIYTTIDVNIQDVAESSLRKALTNYSAAYGCAIVMEVSTGEIRALTNLSLSNGKYEEVKNFALAEGTDPGSTFKLATMMAVLEETGLNPKQEWVETGNGQLLFRNRYIRDTKRNGHGTITVQQVMEKSSNIGVHLLAQKYFAKKPDKFIQYLDKFHLRKPTGIHMKGEATPFVSDPGQWSKQSLSSMSYGYEMRITPLQILALYNAVANNGYWVRPMVVKQIRNAEEVVEQFEPYTEKLPISSATTISKVRDMLEGVVLRGTARNIYTEHYSIAGKTGTAQQLISGNYVKGKYYTSFAGYFPAKQPKYSCIVVISTPRGYSMEQLYAGSVAAPVFKQISDRIYATDLSLHKPIKPAPPAQPTSVRLAGTHADLKAITGTLVLPKVPESGDWLAGSFSTGGKAQWQELRPAGQIPNLSGLTLRDALYLLENKGYQVSYKGTGKVVEQSQLPGEKKMLLLLR